MKTPAPAMDLNFTRTEVNHLARLQGASIHELAINRRGRTCQLDFLTSSLQPRHRSRERRFYLRVGFGIQRLSKGGHMLNVLIYAHESCY